MPTTFRKILGQSSNMARAALALVAASIFAANAFAEPPSRVGRVSLVEGNVSFFMDRNEGWKPARINFPVTSENSVWTEGASRAEVRIGASAVRVDDNSILDFIRIDDDQTQAFLQRGTISIRTRGYGRDDNDGIRNYLSVETSAGRFVIDKNGRYRIDVSQDGSESRISVYAGRARYEGTNSGESAVIVDRGRTLVAQGARGSTNFRFETAAESTFDRWADSRDRSWDQAHTRYVTSEIVSPYMTGYEELDSHGDWIDNGEYGRVWAPRYVSSGWAPYRHGSWSYVSPWGWTWVDEAPWGFAPFHYGRWVTINSRWCWWPGQYQRRPVYAPALVAWYGRPGLSVNVSVGEQVGWFPLAPREYYVPRYTNNVNYIRNVNYVTNNVTIINNNPPARYQNQVPGATFVNQNVFVQSKPVAVNAIRETPANIATFKPSQVMDVPRPIMQGQPVLAGQPTQQGNSANSVWARGRNNVAPVYAAPQMQGQQIGQPQIQGGQVQNQQVQQNQVPGRVGGAAVAGAAVAGAAVGVAGAAMINNGAPQIRGDAINRPVAPVLNAPPQTIAPVAPVVNGAVVGNAKPLQVAPQTQSQPQPQATQQRVGGAPNAIPPVPVAVPVSPAPIAVQSTQRPPIVNQMTQQQQQPQPAYVQQGAKPGQINGGEQQRVRPNRGPEPGDVYVKPQARPQREMAPQNIPQNAMPVQRQERQERQQERQAQAAQRIQPQQQVQQIQPQQQAQQQPRPQAHSQQQQHAEKPQNAEKQPKAPRVEGQAKPGQQQQ